MGWIITAVIIAIVFMLIGFAFIIIGGLGFLEDRDFFFLFLALLGAFNIWFATQLPGWAIEEEELRVDCAAVHGQIVDKVCYEPLIEKDMSVVSKTHVY